MAEPIRILILEDSIADAELILFELEEVGLSFTAKVVKTERDFVRELKTYPPDIILADYDLPAYDGAQALQEAKRRCPDIPFILVTGAIGEDHAIGILTQGAEDYVLKRRLQQRLAPAIRRALAEAEERFARKKAEAELRAAYEILVARDKEREAEREAELRARRKMEEALRESEARENEHIARLRHRARERMKLDTAGEFSSEAGLQKLLRELRISKIELEIQNDELIRSRTENDELLASYRDIYDFAPVAYFSLNPDGIITRVNLAGANLLSVERSKLIGSQFRSYVSADYLLVFNAFFAKTFADETLQSCVMKLSAHRSSRIVRLQGRLSEDGKECLLAAMDITDGKSAESLKQPRYRHGN